MRFEKASFESRQHEEREIVEKAAERAEEVLAAEAIDIEDFVDLYGAETVAADRAYVANLEREFRENAASESRIGEKASKVVEVVIGEGIGLHDWMGGSANFIVPSRYDDIRNGIDGLVEFSEEGRFSHLGLAVDATFGGNVGAKIEKIERWIERGDEMGMKYFQSEAMGFRGELRSIPRVVAAFDARTTLSFADLWVHKKKQELASHPAQFQLLEELLSQCRYFENLAAGHGQHGMKARYEHAAAIIAEVTREREQVLGDRGERDTRFYELMGELG